MHVDDDGLQPGMELPPTKSTITNEDCVLLFPLLVCRLKFSDNANYTQKTSPLPPHHFPCLFSFIINAFCFVNTESGRLFVFGENPCGQLAIGSCENIVTKPSCVKEIKKLGHTVKDFQYGGNFSVLLTGEFSLAVS